MHSTDCPLAITDDNGDDDDDDDDDDMMMSFAGPSHSNSTDCDYCGNNARSRLVDSKLVLPPGLLCNGNLPR